jgi:polar amino acid transport system substrate-binding protein
VIPRPPNADSGPRTLRPLSHTPYHPYCLLRQTIPTRKSAVLPTRRSYLVALLLSLLLPGCGDPEGAASGEEGADAIGAPGTPTGPLLVAADVGFAPHAMARPDGSAEGFNVDLAAEIAIRLGRPGYEIVDQEFSGVFAGLSAGRFEFIIAPTTMTLERSREVLFVEGYLDTDYTFVLNRDAPDIASLDDIRGQAIAVNNGSAYDVWATNNADEYDLDVQRYGKNADAVQAVLTGRAAFNLAGGTVARWVALQNPRLKAGYTISTGSKFSAGFRHEDVAYRNQVEDALECMKVDGTMARLHEKWFGEPPIEGSAALTVTPGYGEPGMEGYDPTPHTLSCG